MLIEGYHGGAMDGTGRVPNTLFVAPREVAEIYSRDEPGNRLYYVTYESSNPLVLRSARQYLEVTSESGADAAYSAAYQAREPAAYADAFQRTLTTWARNQGYDAIVMHDDMFDLDWDNATREEETAVLSTDQETILLDPDRAKITEVKESKMARAFESWKRQASLDRAYEVETEMLGQFWDRFGYDPVNRGLGVLEDIKEGGGPEYAREIAQMYRDGEVSDAPQEESDFIADIYDAVADALGTRESSKTAGPRYQPGLVYTVQVEGAFLESKIFSRGGVDMPQAPLYVGQHIEYVGPVKGFGDGPEEHKFRSIDRFGDDEAEGVFHPNSWGAPTQGSLTQASLPPEVAQALADRFTDLDTPSARAEMEGIDAYYDAFYEAVAEHGADDEIAEDQINKILGYA